MADSNQPAARSEMEDLRDNESEAAQKRPQPAVQPLRPAMVMGIKSDLDGRKDSDSSTKGGVPKAVSIAAEPESIILPAVHHSEQHLHKHQVSAGIGKRLTGRPTSAHSSSKISLKSQNSFEDLPAAAIAHLTEAHAAHKSNRRASGHHHHDRLLKQVSDWLQVQKSKSATRRALRRKDKKQTAAHKAENLSDIAENPARPSEDSDASSISLSDLEKIMEAHMSISSSRYEPAQSPHLAPRRPSYSLSKRPSSRRMSKAAGSSDTEFYDGDVLVPSCDVVLDNSKTLSFSGGTAASEPSLHAAGNRAEKEAKAWLTFKSEILRLAHTLRLKGWRRVPLERGTDIEVERLSGALTNAVYVVSPPKNMPQPEDGKKPKKPPAKLLLRIYGPQVEHLIDREAELAILRRLARKKIGPRMLGTFRNGRFEEYFASTTLTADDIRAPETSKQIAKRMRELHDGIDLLEKERDEGAFVWRNWDKWVDRCEHVIKFLDNQVMDKSARRGSVSADSWMRKGFVCGVEWKMFRKMVEHYRKWLDEKYGGTDGLRSELVFAHNDTQYGNILRLLPTTESPLLLPANSHKQLVVIDFEYASANTPGLEFANHFTEWCYNYHAATTPEACTTKNYPTPEEQRRFIRAYLNHRPQFVASASATPKARPSPGPSSTSGVGISSFMLDARTPAGSTSSYQEEERRREEALEGQVERLIKETRWWRVANSAQWVAWGIVQANVPELDELDGKKAGEDQSQTSNSPVIETPQSEVLDGLAGGAEVQLDGAVLDKEERELVGEEIKEEEEEEEFDYIAYAQDRAMFFWGDCVDLGLIGREELPETLRERIKVIGY